MHGRSARPRRPRDQRCFERPNGILMFKHRGREDGGGRREGGAGEEMESQQRTVSGRLAES